MSNIFLNMFNEPKKETMYEVRVLYKGQWIEKFTIKGELPKDVMPIARDLMKVLHPRKKNYGFDTTKITETKGGN